MQIRQLKIDRYQKAYALAMEIFEISNAFLRRRNIPSQIKSGVHRGRLHKYREAGLNDAMKPISSAN